MQIRLAPYRGRKGRAWPMRHRILIVAQDVTLRSTLARWLMSAGYSVELAEGERRAREVLAGHQIALTILASGRFGLPAFDLDRSCDKRIVVTEPGAEAVPPERSASALNGYLSTPLDEQAVLAGVKSALQAEPDVPDGGLQRPEILSFDDFTIDLAGRLLRAGSGRELPLTRSEFALLVALVRHPGRVLSRDQLLDAVAGRRAEPYDRSIDVLVGRLRKKIEPDPKAPRFILTIVCEGYKFAAKVLEGAPVAPQPSIALSDQTVAEPGSDASHPEDVQILERRQLTLISGELVGVERPATLLDPEDLVAGLSGLHCRCSEIVASFGGNVTRFAGGTMLGCFGYPQAREHDAEQAVRAGLALVE